MTQAHMLFTDETLSYMREVGFENITWSPIRAEITCELSAEYVLVLKKRRKQIKFYLKKEKIKYIYLLLFLELYVI